MLEKVGSVAPHSSTLAWKIPWMEEPGRLQPMGSLRVGDDWATSLSLFPFMHGRRKWQPTPVVLPGESQGWWRLMGCRLWGHAELDTTEWLSSSSSSSVGKVKQGIYNLYCLLWRSLWASALFRRIPHAFVNILYTKWPVLSCSVVSDSATPWTLACQALLPMGILQTRILEWISMSSSRGSSQPRDWTQVSHIVGRFFTVWVTREAHKMPYYPEKVDLPGLASLDRQRRVSCTLC